MDQAVQSERGLRMAGQETQDQSIGPTSQQKILVTETAARLGRGSVLQVPFVRQSLRLFSVPDCAVDDVCCRSRYRSEASGDDGKGHAMR